MKGTECCARCLFARSSRYCQKTCSKNCVHPAFMERIINTVQLSFQACPDQRATGLSATPWMLRNLSPRGLVGCGQFRRDCKAALRLSKNCNDQASCNTTMDLTSGTLDGLYKPCMFGCIPSKNARKPKRQPTNHCPNTQGLSYSYNQLYTRLHTHTHIYIYIHTKSCPGLPSYGH